MLDKTSSIICAFGLASAAPRSPYRHLELCGIAFTFSIFAGHCDSITTSFALSSKKHRLNFFPLL
ncbi:MAG: hypothetical protein ACLT8A_14285 [Subdoligranulum sp.]